MGEVNTDITQLREEILKESAAFYGDFYGLPPLASKINSYLMFDFNREGKTFEELVEYFSASKSSISSNLNTLLSLQLIKDITKPNQRKRYFITNDEFAKIRLSNVAKRLRREADLLEKISVYQEILNKGEASGIQKLKIQSEMLIKHADNIEETIRKL
ncbi:transcriptional regulator [Bergeyella porcorum]|uniref:transcriptional regulator n=1 Tax=Bergeyella porcorum TaxID=1735111 RepID=UPI0035EC2258